MSREPEDQWLIRAQAQYSVLRNSSQLYCLFSLTSKYSLDDLLTNVMIYWVTASIVPSMRYYKENFARDPGLIADSR